MTDPGTTFRGYDEAGHLWLILSLPDQNDQLVLANFTSHWAGSTLHQSCPLILTKRDHPWIRRPTCIFWDGIHLRPRSEIADGIRSGALPTDTPATSRLLSRLHRTALQLPDLPANFRNIISATLATD